MINLCGLSQRDVILYRGFLEFNKTLQATEKRFAQRINITFWLCMLIYISFKRQSSPYSALKCNYYNVQFQLKGRNTMDILKIFVK